MLRISACVNGKTRQHERFSATKGTATKSFDDEISAGKCEIKTRCCIRANHNDQGHLLGFGVIISCKFCVREGPVCEGVGNIKSKSVSNMGIMMSGCKHGPTVERSSHHIIM